ncbi:hypothetical protein [Mesorhizobium sp. B2-3-4]|uniref:DUF6894 family protein n=2 Tax=Mesorhizobium TaxID=68287 RepID=UPI001FF05A59|nr:hypothetical protein [Mesorhizobium sp. B2-3-4]
MNSPEQSDVFLSEMPAVKEPRFNEEIYNLISGWLSMNRYFFDVYNSDGQVLDDDGQFLESRDRARAEALRILHDIARDEMPDRDLVKLTVKVRGDGGAQMFEASLILTSGWSA